ncbi:MAG: hypothetical protein COZ05_10260 [Armatimonadetes bacterium CG_4_10_14_3_um_filter_59_10]|nr:MAG: hypothetical protein COZ05_10260 [Armatimonadetes bacterium CG_4_10_14_3_um_filter_59_10]
MANREKLGKYRIIRELGRGGMGAIYDGESPEGQRVAIKVMLLDPAMDASMKQESLQRFAREARACLALKHPNIVNCLEAAQDPETRECFIVFEFLDGQSVRELIDMVGPLGPARATEIVIDVCEALAYAHETGVVHRDIKPDNIMILKKGGVVKLTDFGLASLEGDSKLTQTGTMMGTFSYMSPEQARGEKLDPRSDIFSLGSTFYEMLTGQKPFPAEATAAVLQKVMTEDPPPVKGLPPNVSTALRRMMQKDPRYRYQNLRDAMTILSQNIGGQGGVSAPSAAVGTAVQRPTAGTAVQRPMAGASTAASAPPGGTAVQRPGAGASAARPAADKGCPKCGERWTDNDLVCWKCGTQNPMAVARRRAREEQNAASDIMNIASSLDPSKKKKWWKPGK